MLVVATKIKARRIAVVEARNRSARPRGTASVTGCEPLSMVYEYSIGNATEKRDR
jgi:hypothetical protein